MTKKKAADLLYKIANVGYIDVDFGDGISAIAAALEDEELWQEVYGRLTVSKWEYTINYLIESGILSDVIVADLRIILKCLKDNLWS